MNKQRYLALGFLLLGIAVLFFFLASGQQTPSEGSDKHEQNEFQVLMPETTQTVYSVSIPDSVSFAGETAPTGIFYVREYLDRELTVNTFWHSATILLLKRAHRWFPLIEPILEKEGIPDDFKYLALIESGLENVTSPAGAIGFWQFLKTTAREKGLEVNDFVDERYHVEKSTKAACRYLKDAHKKFGNWTLVAASYNTGVARISEELKKQKADNYYDLMLSIETTRYVFRILAIKTIFLEKEKYGFYLKNEDLYPPVPTTTVTVTTPITNLVDYAISQGITYKTLKYFNPWLRDNQLPNVSGKEYEIKIPLDLSLSHSKLMERQAAPPQNNK
jgi:hypothetical protein